MYFTWSFANAILSTGGLLMSRFSFSAMVGPTNHWSASMLTKRLHYREDVLNLNSYYLDTKLKAIIEDVKAL